MLIRCSALMALLCLTLQAGHQPQTPPAGFATRDARYKLQSDDVVEVRFRYTPEFNAVATVQPDGFISLQVAGDVHVGGLTLPEAEAVIAKQASARLKAPDVTVLLKDFVKPHFVVAGEVAHPGTFELHGNIGLVQAIAMSGGFRDSAKRTKVVLVRKVNADYARVNVYDMRKLMQPGGIQEDVTIQPNDMIVVPRNRIGKLEPYLRISSLGLYGLTMGIP
jgi:polysaccharide export outer membrane protein